MNKQMKKLTLEQTDFINYLTDGFESINAPISTDGYSIIDLGECITEMTELKRAESELKLFNEGERKLIKAKATKDFNILIGDFKKTNLPFILTLKDYYDGERVLLNIKDESMSDFGNVSIDYSIQTDKAYCEINGNKRSCGDKIIGYKYHTTLGGSYNVYEHDLKSLMNNSEVKRFFANWIKKLI